MHGNIIKITDKSSLPIFPSEKDLLDSLSL